MAIETPAAPLDTAPRRLRTATLRGAALRAVGFLAVFIALQSLWEAARGSAIERWWVQDLTVRGAVALIDALAPQAQAQAQGHRIVASGGGLNVLQGCEGTDVLFLLAAGFAVFPMSWRWRLGGLLLAVAIAYGLNLLRVVGLFFAFRHDAALFDLMHTAGAPLLVVMACGLFFQAWLALAAPPARPDVA
jgi:exosortase family protein XrtM